MVESYTNRQVSLNMLHEIRHTLSVGGFVVLVPFWAQIRRVLDEQLRHSWRQGG